MKDEKPSDLHSADQSPEAVDPELRYQAFLEMLLAEEPELTYESEIMPWWIFPHLVRGLKVFSYRVRPVTAFICDFSVWQVACNCLDSLLLSDHLILF